MACGTHLLDPVRWYLQKLTWSPPGPGHQGTTSIELALNFEAATGVILAPPGVTGPRTLREKAKTFRDAAARVAELSGGKPSPGISVKCCKGIAPMGWPDFSGWDCRAHFLRPGLVKTALAQDRVAKLNATNRRASAYDINPAWPLPAGPPQWIDPALRPHGNQEGDMPTQQPGLAPRIKQHNARKLPDRHVIAAEGEGGLKRTVCSAWAPTRYLSAFTKRVLWK